MLVEAGAAVPDPSQANTTAFCRSGFSREGSGEELSRLKPLLQKSYRG